MDKKGSRCAKNQPTEGEYSAPSGPVLMPILSRPGSFMSPKSRAVSHSTAQKSSFYHDAKCLHMAEYLL